MSNNQPTTFRREFAKQGGSAAVIILVLVVLAEIGAFAYGRLNSRLDREGIATAATVTGIDQYEEIDLTDLVTENSNLNDNGPIITVVQYEFQTESGETYSDEYKSRDLTEIPVIGQKFEMRYAESDPTVHEVRIGHLESNISALHWIAAFFSALTIGYILWGMFQTYRVLNSPQEKRKRRMAQLAAQEKEHG